MLSLSLLLFVALPARLAELSSAREERGQASAEYALVLVGAAAVALLVYTWATRSDLVGRLLDTVLNSILNRVP